MTYQTVSEFAIRQGYCLSTVYQRLRMHKIPGAEKLDGVWRIPVSADVNQATMPKHPLLLEIERHHMLVARDLHRRKQEKSSDDKKSRPPEGGQP